MNNVLIQYFIIHARLTRTSWWFLEVVDKRQLKPICFHQWWTLQSSLRIQHHTVRYFTVAPQQTSGIKQLRGKFMMVIDLTCQEWSLNVNSFKTLTFSSCPVQTSLCLYCPSLMYICQIFEVLKYVFRDWDNIKLN